ncbi:hypothetical protein [Metabacillus sp. Hm71]|uniref:hypothetical protein n=1 Tax=Metabacillus sp. Hm71 TaxID=3450743 RepID=UPI003F434A61
MTYSLIRFIYALFTWVFILSETLFFKLNKNEQIDDRTFFSALTLFIFPFFLDYIKIYLSFDGKSQNKTPFYVNLSFFVTCVGVAFGLGGLFSNVLNVHPTNKTVIFLNSLLFHHGLFGFLQVFGCGYLYMI